jgi:hypothetical protein
MASAYIEAGGFQHELAEVALIAERARVSSWMAVAASFTRRSRNRDLVI